MKGKKILFSYSYFTLGGVEMVIRNRMAILQQMGYDTRAMFLKDYGGMAAFKGLEDRVLVSQDETEMERFIRSFDPDWFVTFDHPDGVELGTRCAPDARQVYEVHTTLTHNLTPLKDKGLLNKISALITPSDIQADWIKPLLPNPIPIYVVPNGINEEFWQDQPDLPKSQHPVIAWVGRLEGHKNWLGYLRLVNRLANTLPDAHFWMVGGQASTLQQHQVLWLTLRKHHLEKRFRWFPEIPPANMPAFLQFVARSGGCFVSTSKGESFGLAVLEAMASGCPVVVPAVGGLTGIIRSGESGLLYQPGNMKEAQNLIEDLVRQPHRQQRIGQNARTAARQYSSTASVETFVRILNQIEQQDPS